jgi:hypothetical protein
MDLKCESVQNIVLVVLLFLFHVFIAFLLKKFCRGLGIEKQLVDLLDFIDANLVFAINFGKYVGRRQKLDGISDVKNVSVPE